MASLLALAALPAGGAAAEDPPRAEPGATAAPVGTATLTVVVDGVAQAKGQLLVRVFTSRAGWPKAEGAAAVVRAPALAPRTEVRVEGLPPGPVAVLVIHDLDGDGKLTMRWFPFPRPGEPVAASNGAKGLVGTPSFEDARIELPSGGATARVGLQ